MIQKGSLASTLIIWPNHCRTWFPSGSCRNCRFCYHNKPPRIKLTWCANAYRVSTNFSVQAMYIPQRWTVYYFSKLAVYGNGNTVDCTSFNSGSVHRLLWFFMIFFSVTCRKSFWKYLDNVHNGFLIFLFSITIHRSPATPPFDSVYSWNGESVMK